MKFWDASAIVPIFSKEPKTPDVQAILARDPEILVWWACRTEVKSAIFRKVREKALTHEDAGTATVQIDAQFSGRSLEIPPEEAVRDEADALLGRHTLRAADAFHLATWRLYGSHLPFVCLDDRLSAAALAEGATVLP